MLTSDFGQPRSKWLQWSGTHKYVPPQTSDEFPGHTYEQPLPFVFEAIGLMLVPQKH